MRLYQDLVKVPLGKGDLIIIFAFKILGNQFYRNRD
jgi:hypothetical protein